jgi:hypothetical protein
MEHFRIFDKICSEIHNTFDSSDTIFGFSSAIYKTWINGTDLEKNLSEELIKKWIIEINYIIDSDYKDRKYDISRPEYKTYRDNYIKMTSYNHPGIDAALERIRIESNNK